MKIFSEKFPDNIPRIFSMFIAVNFGIYWMTCLIADILIGRPSSTEVIGFFTIPFFTLCIALICVWLGRVLRWIVGKFCSVRTIEKKSMRIINIVFVVAIGLSFLAGWLTIMRYEHLQKPRVIYDAGVISKEHVSNLQKGEYTPSKFVFTIYKKEKGKMEELDWNGVKLDVSRPHIKIFRNDGSLMISADLSKYDYIGRIHAAAFGDINKEQKCLALLVKLRPTSYRSMLFIYDSDGALIFQELLKRRCGRKTGGMQVGVDKSKREYLFLNVDSPAIYFIKRQATSNQRTTAGRRKKE